MDHPSRKLRHQTDQQTEQEHQTTSNQQQTTREWNSAEELLREDAEKAAVPPAIEGRLRDSIANEPAPPKRWWQRFFG